MRAWGWIFVLLGLVLTGAGFISDGSVPSGDGYGRVMNMGLLADKLLLVLCGGFSFLSGIVLISAAALRRPDVDTAGGAAEDLKPGYTVGPGLKGPSATE